ncbi:MAG: V-type ATP synthase subunit D [Spirochaetes bacterium]|nr:V-type ATP synthase subunit D [Spirochaetota bacterium]
MKIEVSATRMELLRLRKRLALARRGHKLLKDKQDELMRKFLELIEEYKKSRKQTDQDLLDFYKEYYRATIEYSEERLMALFSYPELELDMQSEIVPVMNLRLPKFQVKTNKEIKCFGVKDVNVGIDFSLARMKGFIPHLVKLAEVENNVKELALEIERTRRRVNALEYILIPDLEETIDYISMKISEVERSNLTRLMKVKEIVERH